MFTGINGQGKSSPSSRGATKRASPLGRSTISRTSWAGESIAVNGTCLTVETFGNRRFSAYASAETLQRTTLGGLKTGDSSST